MKARLLLRLLALATFVIGLASCTTTTRVAIGDNLLAQRAFTAGVTHVAGTYRFTHKNFLIEGAEKMQEMGVKSAFFYLTPNFRKEYPDESGTPRWPQNEPHSLTELAQSAPFADIFSLPFDNIVLTTTSFGIGNHFADCRKHPELLKREEDEFYELTKYLLKNYQNKNKVFILKHWEGDWMLLHSYDAKKQADDEGSLDMIAWLKARQAGVSRARKEMSTLPRVAVYNAVEVNRVLDYSRQGLDRAVNLVLPKVGADMVSYSSYDAMLSGSATNKTTTKANLSEALHVIDKFAPDPLGLGKKRIFISEFGLSENKMKSPDEALWRTEAVLEAAREFGASFAFFWELYDNECNTPIIGSLSNKPANNACKGFWLVKPDGHPSEALTVLKRYFAPQGSQS